MSDWLIRLLVDAALLAGLVLFFGSHRFRRAPRALLVGLGLALTWLVCKLLLGWLLGFLLILPLAILTGAVLMVYGRLRLKRAAFATAIFLAGRVVLGTIVAWVL